MSSRTPPASAQGSRSEDGSRAERLTTATTGCGAWSARRTQRHRGAVLARRYSSVRTVPAPATMTSDRARSSEKTARSAPVLIDPDLPSSPVTAPSRVVTKFARTHGRRAASSG